MHPSGFGASMRGGGTKGRTYKADPVVLSCLGRKRLKDRQQTLRDPTDDEVELQLPSIWVSDLQKRVRQPELPDAGLEPEHGPEKVQQAQSRDAWGFGKHLEGKDTLELDDLG